MNIETKRRKLGKDINMSTATMEPPVYDEPELATARIRLLIADDHPMVIVGIRRTVEHCDDIEVVGEANSGPELLRLIERRNPSLVLLDLRMPGVIGFECIEQIHETWPEIKTVVLSACDDRASIDGALHAGASAYILKSAAPADVASALRQTASGAIFHSPSTPAHVSNPANTEPDGPILTDREQTILTAVATGLTTAAISRELWVSEHTVKFHLTNIYRKLGVANRAGAVRYACEHHRAAA